VSSFGRSFVRGGGRYGALGEEGLEDTGADEIEDGSLRLRVSMGGIDMDDIGGFAFEVTYGGQLEGVTLSCDVVTWGIGKRIEYLNIDHR